MQRNTRQQAAIRDAIHGADRPLSPNEILDAARERVPGLGLATVYRQLKVLVEDKWLTEVGLPGEANRYEVAGKEHHHHFHCRKCDRVFEVPGCQADLRRMVPRGFELDAHEIVLYGRCSTCTVLP